jgi:hypothetical protein
MEYRPESNMQRHLPADKIADDSASLHIFFEI